MAAFKDTFDLDAARRLAKRFERVDPDAFVAAVEPTLFDLELKDRVDLFTRTLAGFLPDDFPTAIGLILEALPPALEGTESVSSGFELWPLCHFVELYGQPHFEDSFGAMYQLTRRFSCEFAIRPFLDSDPDRALEILHGWAEDEDVHVRRLVSEGTRPRLPWGMRLNGFVENPEPVLELIVRLRNDPEEYVRRSVANNLNDIAKDHPDRVVAVANDWWTSDNDTQRLIRHGLRTLIKQGHPGALKVLGFGPASLSIGTLSVDPSVHIGDDLSIRMDLVSSADHSQDLLIDYAVHHVRANGDRTPKVFKWTKRTLVPDEPLNIEKNHSFRRVTTRRYYPGVHLLEIFVNGESVAEQEFELIDERRRTHS